MHPFLALALSHIAKSSSKQVGHVIGDAFDNAVLSGYNYEKIISNPENLAEYILIGARERGIPIREEDKEKLIVAIQKAARIADKLTDDVSEERLDALHQALVEKTEDPLYVLKRNGIDIEPELEEFRQFLAEISGKKIEPARPKYPATKKEIEQELRKAGVPEEKIYAELEKRGIPRDVAEKLVEKVHLLSSREVGELIRKHVDNDPVKARAVLEAFERKGKVVPVPRYWADIVSKIATGEIKEKELLEALAVSKVFHTAYLKAMEKAAERDEPESVMQRMMFIKNVVNDAHREAVDALKDHPVYGEHVKRMSPAIEREMKEIAETLSKTYYAKARGDPTLSARTFLQMELNPTVETLGPVRSHLKKVNEDFLAIGKPQEETIAKVYPAIVKRLLGLALGMEVENKWVGITHKHEVIRIKLNALL